MKLEPGIAHRDSYRIRHLRAMRDRRACDIGKDAPRLDQSNLGRRPARIEPKDQSRRLACFERTLNRE
ncbi:MAG TPA: hypothetical protein VNF45_05950 [Candidatus Binataceae bacterium]|nr:hypothetical protein [Candidatus Binataceae bacterium]